MHPCSCRLYHEQRGSSESATRADATHALGARGQRRAHHRQTGWERIVQVMSRAPQDSQGSSRNVALLFQGVWRNPFRPDFCGEKKNRVPQRNLCPARICALGSKLRSFLVRSFSLWSSCQTCSPRTVRAQLADDPQTGVIGKMICFGVNQTHTFSAQTSRSGGVSKCTKWIQKWKKRLWTLKNSREKRCYFCSKMMRSCGPKTIIIVSDVRSLISKAREIKIKTAIYTQHPISLIQAIGSVTTCFFLLFCHQFVFCESLFCSLCVKLSIFVSAHFLFE